MRANARKKYRVSGIRRSLRNRSAPAHRRFEGDDSAGETVFPFKFTSRASETKDIGVPMESGNRTGADGSIENAGRKDKKATLTSQRRTLSRKRKVEDDESDSATSKTKRFKGERLPPPEVKKNHSSPSISPSVNGSRKKPQQSSFVSPIVSPSQSALGMSQPFFSTTHLDTMDISQLLALGEGLTTQSCNLSEGSQPSTSQSQPSASRSQRSTSRSQRSTSRSQRSTFRNSAGRNIQSSAVRSKKPSTSRSRQSPVKSRSNQPPTSQSKQCQRSNKSQASTAAVRSRNLKLVAEDSKDENAHDTEDDSDDDDDDEFEEVTAPMDAMVERRHAPHEGVQVTVPHPDGRERRKKKGFDPQEHLRKHLNRIQRAVQEEKHKVHLLCYVAHYLYLNRLLNDPELQARAVSFLSSDTYPKGAISTSYIEGFTRWFVKRFPFSDDDRSPCSSMASSPPPKKKGRSSSKGKDPMPKTPLAPVPSWPQRLNKVLDEARVSSVEEQVYLYILMTRALGADVRLVASFRPVPLKPPHKELLHASKTLPEIGSSPKSEPASSASELQPSTSTSNAACRRKGKSSPGGKVKSASRKVLSSDSDDEIDSRKGEDEKGKRNVWIEVFVEKETKWICIDLGKGSPKPPLEIEAAASRPVSYVVAFNTDGTLKDVTARYASQWLTQTCKRRVGSAWWQDSLRPFREKRTARSKAEDKEIDDALYSRNAPTSVTGFKDHPLFILQRHLKKYEAIYPPDASPCGFMKGGEPFYARALLQTLRSRELWMREARVVRIGEEPYKRVKARVKYDKLSGARMDDRLLELFGKWQTETYIPPIAQNGIVPKNEYGNVELFKPSMLPGGTVHIKISNILRVARKLKIDVAPAVVGFDFHSGGSHPVFDGVIVCEEFAEILLDAWDQEENVAAQRHEEKREKRVLALWRKLTRGLLIRERLKEKYDFEDKQDHDATPAPRSEGASTSLTN